VCEKFADTGWATRTVAPAPTIGPNPPIAAGVPWWIAERNARFGAGQYRLVGPRQERIWRIADPSLSAGRRSGAHR
jgi:hypothetical protein